MFAARDSTRRVGAAAAGLLPSAPVHAGVPLQVRVSRREGAAPVQPAPRTQGHQGA